MNDGKDLRSEKLTDRKHELRRLLTKASASRILHADHIERHGMALFQRICEMDLEGIVAKHSFGVYVTEQERTIWFKIRNRTIPRWQVVKNYLSDSATKILLLVGTVANWIV